MTDDGDTDGPSPRLDKWLWHARVFKTRTLASKVCASGRVRVNGTPVAKSHHALRPGDVLTLPVGSRIRVLRVLAIGARRGPAPEARLLYDDLTPPPDDAPTPGAGEAPPGSGRAPGAGRPTKAERRAVDRLRDRD